MKIYEQPLNQQSSLLMGGSIEQIKNENYIFLEEMDYSREALFLDRGLPPRGGNAAVKFCLC